MHDSVTVLGRLTAEPTRNSTSSGASVVNFRVACSQGYYDRATQAWVETGTNFYNVSAFRRLADNAKASLHKGESVIVTGRLKLREWQNGDKRGMTADIEADAIGHDLRRGATASFANPLTADDRRSAPPQPESEQPAPVPVDDQTFDESSAELVTAGAPAGDGSAWDAPDDE